MTELTLCSKYEPLAELSTRYAIVSGGRGSGKSFAIASILIAKTELYKGKTILFTRYTLTNAETSIIPEFMDKIERGHLQGRFKQSGNDIVNLATGTRILFRGIKTSSGVNTAALKSIPNLVLWVNDESEELVDEATFDTIDLSIRDKNAHCEVWLVLNPSDVRHFIYRKFFAGYNVDGGFNGVKDDVTYIHTSYLDNLDNLDEEYIAKAEKLKVTDNEKYRHLWLGEWTTHKEGLIYRNWQPISEADYPNGLPQWYGNDWGYSDDPDALVRMCYDPAQGRLYVREIGYSTGMLPRDVAKLIIADAATIGYKPEDCIVYCDPARPEGIAELRVHYGINAVPAVNRDKPGRIAWLRGFQVSYCGENIGKEVAAYSYKPDKNDRSRYTDEPQDGNDHAMDSLNYAAVSHLRRMGITNDYGEK